MVEGGRVKREAGGLMGEVGRVKRGEGGLICVTPVFVQAVMIFSRCVLGWREGV